MNSINKTQDFSHCSIVYSSADILFSGLNDKVGKSLCSGVIFTTVNCNGVFHVISEN